MRFRRDAEEEGGVMDTLKEAEESVENAIVDTEHKLEDAVTPIADTVGMEPW